MPFDPTAWLKEIAADGSLSADEIATLTPILSKEQVRSKLDNQLLMRSDYSRKTQELADQRRGIDSERAELEAWRTKVQSQLDRAFSDLQSERTTRAQFEARMRTIADQHNLDLDQLLAGTQSAARELNAATREEGRSAGLSDADVDRIVNERVSKVLGDTGAMAGALNAEISDIADEHRELFGTRLNRRELFDKALAFNQDRQRQKLPIMTLRDYWNQEFKVSDKIKENERKAITAEVRKELDTEYRSKLSENLLDGKSSRIPGTEDQHSIVFSRDLKTPAEKEAARSKVDGAADQTRSRPTEERTAPRNEERWQKAAHSYRDRRVSGIPLGKEAETAGSAAASEA